MILDPYITLLVTTNHRLLDCFYGQSLSLSLSVRLSDISSLDQVHFTSMAPTIFTLLEQKKLTNLHLFPGICCPQHAYQPSFTDLTLCLLVFPSRLPSSCPAA